MIPWPKTLAIDDEVSFGLMDLPVRITMYRGFETTGQLSILII